MKIIKYDCIDSTNNEAKRLITSGFHEGAVIATEQTNGRGRYGNSWYSPPGSLYMSLILERDYIEKITITAAVSVSAVFNAKIKWVNDIIIDQKKVGGILAEAFGDFIILGIGVNLNNTDFPDELKGKAAFVYSCDVHETAEEVITQFENDYKELKSGGFSLILEKYKKNCLTLGNNISFSINNNPETGFAFDIDDNGGLLVRTTGGVITLTAGEVSIRAENGEYL